MAAGEPGEAATPKAVDPAQQSSVSSSSSSSSLLVWPDWVHVLRIALYNLEGVAYSLLMTRLYKVRRQAGHGLGVSGCVRYVTVVS